MLSKHKSTVDYAVSYYYYLTNRIEIIKKLKFVHVIKLVNFSPNVKFVLHVRNDYAAYCKV